jgi:hypothetical protein
MEQPPVEPDQRFANDRDGEFPSTDAQGIASASRSCLVILALVAAIVLVICLSTAIRLVTG